VMAKTRKRPLVAISEVVVLSSAAVAGATGNAWSLSSQERQWV
jgi:hypothetical protein